VSRNIPGGQARVILIRIGLDYNCRTQSGKGAKHATSFRFQAKYEKRLSTRQDNGLREIPVSKEKARDTNIKYLAVGIARLYQFLWRREWDSNP
jgi:hypothetical protein